MAAIDRFTTEYDRHYQWYPRRVNKTIKDGIDFAGKESQKMYFSNEPPIQHKRRINGPYTNDHLKLEFDSSVTPDEDDYMLLGEKNERFSTNVPYRNSAKMMPKRPKTAPARKSRDLKNKAIQSNNFDVNGYVSTPDTPRIEKRPQRPFTADPRRQRRISPPTKKREGYYTENQRSRSQDIQRRNEAIQTKNSYNLEESIKKAANKGIQHNNFGQYDPSYYDTFQRTKKNEPLKERPVLRKKEFQNKSINKVKSDNELKMKAKVRARKSPSPPKWLPPKYYIKNGEVYSGNAYKDDLSREIDHLKSKTKKEPNEVDHYYAKRYELGINENRAKPVQRLSEYQRSFDWKPTNLHSEPYYDLKDWNRSYLDQPKNLSRPFNSTEYQREFAPLPAPRHRSVSPNRNREKSINPRGVPIKDTEKRYRSSSPPLRRERNKRPITPPPTVFIGKQAYTPATVLNPQRMSFPLGPRQKRLSEYSSKFKNYYTDAKLQKEEEFIVDKENKPHSSWYQEISDLRKKAEEYKLRARGTHFSREHTAQLLSNANPCWDPPSTQSARDPPFMQDYEPGENRPRSTSPKRFSEEDSANEIGRISTPKMKSRSFNRHHLDRTTPAGVISSQKSTMVGRDMSRSKSKALPKRKSSLFDVPAGKPSYDAHLILDEEASHDTPLKSIKKVEAPTLKSRSRVKSKSRDDPNQPLKNGLSHQNGMLYAPNKTDLRLPIKPDYSGSELSTSVRSLASSASLASETLERARRRRDEFWNQ